MQEKVSLFKIQGFLGNDLVYGTGRKSDVLTQAGQVVHKPMYEAGNTFI